MKSADIRSIRSFFKKIKVLAYGHQVQGGRNQAKTIRRQTSARPGRIGGREPFIRVNPTIEFFKNRTPTNILWHEPRSTRIKPGRTGARTRTRTRVGHALPAIPPWRDKQADQQRSAIYQERPVEGFAGGAKAEGEGGFFIEGLSPE